MIKAVAELQPGGLVFAGGNITIDVVVYGANEAVQRTTLSFSNPGGATASQALGAIKTQVIAYALAQYGMTLVASEIVVIGAPA